MCNLLIKKYKREKKLEVRAARAPVCRSTVQISSSAHIIDIIFVLASSVFSSNLAPKKLEPIIFLVYNPLPLKARVESSEKKLCITIHALKTARLDCYFRRYIS